MHRTYGFIRLSAVTALVSVFLLVVVLPSWQLSQQHDEPAVKAAPVTRLQSTPAHYIRKYTSRYLYYPYTVPTLYMVYGKQLVSVRIELLGPYIVRYSPIGVPHIPKAEYPDWLQDCPLIVIHTK